MFDPKTLRHAATDILDVAFHETGPGDGPVAILLHGWPDDAHTWAQVAPRLNTAGWRTIVPYLRGFGQTRFLRGTTRRSGDLTALAKDTLDLAAALSIDQFAVAGHDWGARAAYIAACLVPEQVTQCAALSVGWGTNDPTQTLSLKQIQNYWYHWYLCLGRGEELANHEREAFTRYIWDAWALKRRMDAAEFARLARSFDTPDWAAVVVHSYRVRWGLAEPDPAYAALSARVRENPTIRVPTLVLHGGADPCNDPSTSEGKEMFFSDHYERQVLPGIGHFPQWEAPDETARALIEFLGERN